MTSFRELSSLDVMEAILKSRGIELGREYVYTQDLPVGCKGAHYYAHFLILDVPSGQWKILVEALNGRDAGLRFCCTPANFERRYELLSLPSANEGKHVDLTKGHTSVG